MSVLSRWWWAVAVAALLVGSAHARRLPFDDVCAAPPCPLGGQYAALGLALASPGASAIMGGGAGGVTGTNGPAHVQVPAPHSLTLSNTRTMRFASLDVARTGVTAAGTAVIIYPTTGGTPSGPPRIQPLGAVNQWLTVIIVEPGGFDGLLLQGSGGGDLTFALDNVALGGTCAQLADVSPANAELCRAAEALYHRGVTRGCTDSAYCPGDPTSRGAMALFLSRTITEVAPTASLFTTSLTGVNLATGHVCAPSTPFQFDSNKLLEVRGEAVVSNAAPGSYVNVEILHSLNFGATWSPLPSGDPAGRKFVGGLTGAERESVGLLSRHVPLLQDVPLLGRLFVSGTGTADVKCNLLVVVAPRIVSGADPP
jgi:hypothetical protein